MLLTRLLCLLRVFVIAEGKEAKSGISFKKSVYEVVNKSWRTEQKEQITAKHATVCGYGTCYKRVMKSMCPMWGFRHTKGCDRFDLQ